MAHVGPPNLYYHFVSPLFTAETEYEPPIHFSYSKNKGSCTKTTAINKKSKPF